MFFEKIAGLIALKLAEELTESLVEQLPGIAEKLIELVVSGLSEFGGDWSKTVIDEVTDSIQETVEKLIASVTELNPFKLFGK